MLPVLLDKVVVFNRIVLHSMDFSSVEFCSSFCCMFIFSVEYCVIFCDDRLDIAWEALESVNCSTMTEILAVL